MNKRPAIRAFTLLELLVAVTITVLLATLMLSVTSGVLTLWRRSQAAQVQAATARQVFDLLEQDFQAMLHRRDANHWLAVDIIDSPGGLANHGWLVGPGRMKPPSSLSWERTRFGLSGSWLRFVTTHIESGGSLPVVVAYQVARRPVTGDPVPANPAPVRYALYRSAVGSAETLSDGTDVTSPNYASTTNTPPSFASGYRQARNVMNPSGANLLASHVVDFGVRLQVRSADGSLRTMHPADSADDSHHALGASADVTSGYPEVVDVMLRILTEEGATLLAAIETNSLAVRPPAYATDADWWWGVVEAHSRVFVRRMEIKGTAL